MNLVQLSGAGRMGGLNLELNKVVGKDVRTPKTEGAMICDSYIPEKDNPYPLCDNKECGQSTTCNLSLYMDESPYYQECCMYEIKL